MRSSDRAVLLIIPLVAALVAVWLLVISPKRAEVSDLDDQVAALQTQADQAESEAATAEQAKKGFDKNYAALIKLGAAAPADDDQSTLVYTLADIANENDMRFSGFTLAETPAGIDESTAPPVTTTGTESGSTATSGTSTEGGTTTTPTDGSAAAPTTTTTTTTAPATEAVAASLPLGSAVGPAGFPISTYGFTLHGKFFGATDFLAQVDKLVEASPTGGPKVHGRLLTIDGFSFALEQLDDYPTITANLAVTAYEVPADQGLQAGATPAGPAPAGTTTTGTTTSTSTAAPTASVTP